MLEIAFSADFCPRHPSAPLVHCVRCVIDVVTLHSFHVPLTGKQTLYDKLYTCVAVLQYVKASRVGVFPLLGIHYNDFCE